MLAGCVCDDGLDEVELLVLMEALGDSTFWMLLSRRMRLVKEKEKKAKKTLSHNLKRAKLSTPYLILLTDGTLKRSQMLASINLSRISQAKMLGSFFFCSLTKATTLGVVTRGLLPPIAPGKIEPVSL